MDMQPLRSAYYQANEKIMDSIHKTRVRNQLEVSLSDMSLVSGIVPDPFDQVSFLKIATKNSVNGSVGGVGFLLRQKQAATFVTSNRLVQE